VNYVQTVLAGALLALTRGTHSRVECACALTTMLFRQTSIVQSSTLALTASITMEPIIVRLVTLILIVCSVQAMKSAQRARHLTHYPQKERISATVLQGPSLSLATIATLSIPVAPGTTMMAITIATIVVKTVPTAPAMMLVLHARPPTRSITHQLVFAPAIGNSTATITKIIAKPAVVAMAAVSVVTLTVTAMCAALSGHGTTGLAIAGRLLIHLTRSATSVQTAVQLARARLTAPRVRAPSPCTTLTITNATASLTNIWAATSTATRVLVTHTRAKTKLHMPPPAMTLSRLSTTLAPAQTTSSFRHQ